MNRRPYYTYAVTELICTILFLVYTQTSDGDANSYFELQDAQKRIIIIYLTLWELLEKRIILHMVKFISLFVTKRLIAMVNNASLWSLSRAR
jgi:hypothetical protein